VRYFFSLFILFSTHSWSQEVTRVRGDRAVVRLNSINFEIGRLYVVLTDDERVIVQALRRQQDRILLKVISGKLNAGDLITVSRERVPQEMAALAEKINEPEAKPTPEPKPEPTPVPTPKPTPAPPAKKKVVKPEPPPEPEKPPTDPKDRRFMATLGFAVYKPGGLLQEGQIQGEYGMHTGLDIKLNYRMTPELDIALGFMFVSGSVERPEVLLEDDEALFPASLKSSINFLYIEGRYLVNEIFFAKFGLGLSGMAITGNMDSTISGFDQVPVEFTYGGRLIRFGGGISKRFHGPWVATGEIIYDRLSWSKVANSFEFSSINPSAGDTSSTETIQGSQGAFGLIASISYLFF
jgi:hypothetical protein